MAEQDRVTVQVELNQETIRKIAEVQPAVTDFAKEHFGETKTGQGDVIALAVHLLHLQTVGRAQNLVAAAQAAREEAEGDGAELWPASTMH